MGSAVRPAVVAVVVVHALLHLLTTLDSLGRASVLSAPPDLAEAAGWTLAGVLLLAAALSLATRRSWSWALTGTAAVASQVMVLLTWDQTWPGTVPNLLLAAATAYEWSSRGPTSLRHDFERRARRARLTASYDGARRTPVTDSDLADLPAALAGYLRASGVVGHVPVRLVETRIHGRLRPRPGDGWLEFTGEQVLRTGPDPERLVWMEARTRHGVPVDLLQTLSGTDGGLRIWVASVLPLADASGADVAQTQAVSLVHEVCTLAPGALLDLGGDWTDLGGGRVHGRWLVAGQQVQADLLLDDEDRLVEFDCPERVRLSPEGTLQARQRWSTPVTRYAGLGGHKAAVEGEAHWHAGTDARGEAYEQFWLDEVRFDGHPAARDP